MGKLRRRRKGASPVVTSTRHFVFSSTTVDRRCGHGQSQRPTSQLSSSDAQNVRRPINSEPKRFSSVPTTAPHALRIEPPFKCLSFPDACREGTGGPLHSQVHTTLLTRQTLVRPRVVRKRANIPRCTFLKPPRPYQSLSQAPARLPASIQHPSIPPTCKSNGAEPRRLARRLVTNRSSGGIYYRKVENDRSLSTSLAARTFMLLLALDSIFCCTILYISPLLFVQHQMSLQTPLTHESPKRVVSSFFQHSLNCSPTHNQRIDLSFGMAKRSCDFTRLTFNFEIAPPSG